MRYTSTWKISDWILNLLLFKHYKWFLNLLKNLARLIYFWQECWMYFLWNGQRTPLVSWFFSGGSVEIDIQCSGHASERLLATFRNSLLVPKVRAWITFFQSSSIRSHCRRPSGKVLVRKYSVIENNDSFRWRPGSLLLCLERAYENVGVMPEFLWLKKVLRFALSASYLL